MLSLNIPFSSCTNEKNNQPHIVIKYIIRDGFTTLDDAANAVKIYEPENAEEFRYINIFGKWYAGSVNSSATTLIVGVDWYSCVDLHTGQIMEIPLDFGPLMYQSSFHNTALEAKDTEWINEEQIISDLNNIPHEKEMTISVHNPDGGIAASKDTQMLIGLFARSAICTAFSVRRAKGNSAFFEKYVRNEFMDQMTQRIMQKKMECVKYNPFCNRSFLTDSEYKKHVKEISAEVPKKAVYNGKVNNLHPDQGNNGIIHDPVKHFEEHLQPQQEQDEDEYTIEAIKQHVFGGNPLGPIFLRMIGMTGVSVISAPTGSTKTFTLTSVIAILLRDTETQKKYCQDSFINLSSEAPHFVVISPLLNNLDELEKNLKKRGVRYYRAKSTSDILKEFFVKEGKPDFNIIKNDGAKSIPKEYTEISSHYKDMLIAIKCKDMLSASKEYSGFAHDIRAKIKEEAEIAGRPIGELLKDTGYDWVKRLYPDICGIHAPVILMSAAKELTNIIAPVHYNGPREWYKYLNGCSGIVFIRDESDSEKEAQRNQIISKATSHTRTDLLASGYLIAQRIITAFKEEGQNVLYSEAIGYGEKHNKNMQRCIDDVVRNCENLISDYHLGTSFRIGKTNDTTTQSGKDEYLFLYTTGSETYTTNGGDLKFITGTDGTNLTELPKSEKKSENIKTVTDYVNDVTHLIKLIVRKLLRPVAQYRHEKIMENGRVITEEEAYDKVLTDLSITFRGTSEAYALMKNAYAGPKLNNPVIREDSNTSHTLYDEGFLNCMLKAGDQENINLNATQVTFTPEIIVLADAENHPELLISATAESPSIMNYNMDFIRDRLGNKLFHMMTDEDRAAITQYMHYDDMKANVSYHVASGTHFTDIQNGLTFEKHFEQAFSHPVDMANKKRGISHDEAVSKVRKVLAPLVAGKTKDAHYYEAFRYLFFLEGYIYVRSKGANAIIAFASKGCKGDVDTPVTSYKKEYDFCIHIVKELCNIADDFYFSGVHASHNSFLATTEVDEDMPISDDGKYKSSKFQKFMDTLSKGYTEGSPVVIYTTYQTSMTGMNFTIHSREDDNLFVVPVPGRIADEMKDFNGLIFAGPTHVQVNGIDPKEHDHIKISNAYCTRIYEIEELYFRGDIGREERYEYITKPSFRSADNKTFWNTDKKSFAYKSEVVRKIRQASGRIMRTVSKDKNVGIYIDETLRSSLQCDYQDHRNDTPVMQKIFEWAGQKPEKSEIYTISANALALKGERLQERTYTYYLYRPDRDNDDRAIGPMIHANAYDNLGQCQLTHGIVIGEREYRTLKKQEYRDCYTKVPNGITAYWYLQMDNYKNIKVSFEKENGYSEVSDERSLLFTYLSIPGVRTAMERDGLYTGWSGDESESLYMLNPTAFNNYYKGRLSEYVTKVILHENAGFKIDEIMEPELKERADFVSGRCAIDVKQYEYITAEHINRSDLYKRSAWKTSLLGKEVCIFILPVMKEGKRSPIINNYPVISDNGKTIQMVEIPGLYYLDENGAIHKNEESYKVLYELLEESS